MRVLRFGVLSALICLFTVFAPMDAVFAQSASKIIKQRQAVMKEFSSHTKAIKKFLKGPSSKLKGKKLARATKRLGTVIDMELRAQALAGQGMRLANFFPKGSGPTDGVGKTRAKQAVWTDRAGFEAAAANFVKLAGDLEKAAASGDKKQMNAALASLGKKGCGGCHRTFRAKKKK